MPAPGFLETAGSIAGILGASYVTFAVVSYNEALRIQRELQARPPATKAPPPPSKSSPRKR
jgi:hypothetical protein